MVRSYCNCSISEVQEDLHGVRRQDRVFFEQLLCVKSQCGSVVTYVFQGKDKDGRTRSGPPVGSGSPPS